MGRKSGTSVFAAFGAAVLFGLACAAQAGGKLPGVGRTQNNVFLFENHSVAYVVWHALQVRGATVVHVDTHEDCRVVPAKNLVALEDLRRQEAWDEVFRLSDMGGKFRFKVHPGEMLLDLGNFIYPCLVDGTIRDYYWVVPDTILVGAQKERLKLHIQRCLGVVEGEFQELPGGAGFSLSFGKGTVHVVTLDGLPVLPARALLDIDVDFFVFPFAMTDNHLMGDLLWDPETVFKTLRARVPDPLAVTISSSVPGGYTPVAFRFLADGAFHFFTQGEYPQEARDLLRTTLEIRRGTPFVQPVFQGAGGGEFAAAEMYLGGFIDLLSGRDAVALAAAEAAAVVTPVYAKALLDFAEAFVYMRKSKLAHQAIDRYDRQVGGEDSNAMAGRIRVYLAEGRLRQADRLSDRLLRWSDEPFFRILRGGVLAEQGRYAEAEAIYRGLLAQTPDYGLAHYNLGLVLSKQGRADSAEACYRNALRQQPEFFAALENLGYLQLQAGRLKEAEATLRQASRLNPFSLTSLGNLGLALVRQGRPTEALGFLRQALRVNPEIPEIYVGMASAYLQMNNPASALEHCKAALTLRPGFPEALQLQAQAQR